MTPIPAGRLDILMTAVGAGRPHAAEIYVLAWQSCQEIQLAVQNVTVGAGEDTKLLSSDTCCGRPSGLQHCNSHSPATDDGKRQPNANTCWTPSFSFF
jgi:hypothetical protein